MTLIYIRDSESMEARHFIKDSISEQGLNSVYSIEEGDLSISPVPSNDETMIFTFLRDMTPEMEDYLINNLRTGLSSTN